MLALAVWCLPCLATYASAEVEVPGRGAIYGPGDESATTTTTTGSGSPGTGGGESAITSGGGTGPASSAPSTNVLSSTSSSGSGALNTETAVPPAGGTAGVADDATADKREGGILNSGQGLPGNEYYGEANLFGNEAAPGDRSTEGGWSLFNLLLAVLALLNTVVVLIRIVVRKLRENEEMKRKVLRFIPSALIGILPILCFLLLEDFSAMVLLSRWTPLVSILTALHFALLVLAGIRSDRPRQADGERELT